MDLFTHNLKSVTTIESAIDQLQSQINITPQIQKTLDFCIHAHKDQKRKSGEPYVVHPILVASITAHFSHDESMVMAALLHDVVEDTAYSLDFVKEEYGGDVAVMVDGLTKIVELRETELSPSSSNEKLITSALTFRKMLLASIDDVRVLVVKLCDRLHNMLTLDALSEQKQLRISEETLVVYAPIAHRLGISTLKNYLEDLSFFYLMPHDYSVIDQFVKSNQHTIQATFNKFISDTQDILEKQGYNKNDYQIFSRIKHHYSIYLKMQRKGTSIEEVLDLMAIRILVKEPIDCYNVLGHIHLAYKPLIARFKDYVSTPKENGYQTLHTTVFHNSTIYEVQLRTYEMHEVAEYGIAAHWIYKNSQNLQSPNLNWLHSLEYSNDDIEEFYSDAKQDLFSEDIVVYSPKGDTFTLPRGSTAIDFAYEIHSDVGNHANECIINTIKKPLLTELRSSDVVEIVTGDIAIPRCSWLEMLKTSKAIKSIKMLCSGRLKEIDQKTGENILNTIFSRYRENIIEGRDISGLHKIPKTLDYAKHIKRSIEKDIRQNDGLVARIKVQSLNLKLYKFDNLMVNSNFAINHIEFDHCCHPKVGDDIVAFRNGSNAFIHHKMCDKAYEMIKNKEQMIYCAWTKNKLYEYKMVISIPSTKGQLAKLLTYMSGLNCYIMAVEYGKDKYSLIQYCDIEFEINDKNKQIVRSLIERKVKVIEFFSKLDAYK
ncbi:MAG: RelA/SpoT family protein [Campylobacterota bacterium]|nr:RelA/SpoT family protein [Campylobacterota bacterium]